MLSQSLNHVLGSPPHTRGILVVLPTGCGKTGFTPAYAGNTFTYCLHFRSPWVHPRIRGEYTGPFRGPQRAKGSPPHTRGIQMAVRQVRLSDRFTPAYAGNTFHICAQQNNTEVHPRIRGEYRPTVLQSLTPMGSPPHTRGILLRGHFGYQLCRFTPAYAGNTEKDGGQNAHHKVHPRIRGEY